MPSETQVEVYRQHRSAQERYVYFLLAAAGAGIALAVNQTHESSLSWSHTPLGAAVLLWGMSFYFGCRHLVHVEATLYSNMTLLKVTSGEDPMVGTHPEKMEIAVGIIRESLANSGRVAGRNAALQFWCLILGAIAFVAWHIYEMYLRSMVTLAGA